MPWQVEQLFSYQKRSILWRRSFADNISLWPIGNLYYCNMKMRWRVRPLTLPATR